MNYPDKESCSIKTYLDVLVAPTCFDWLLLSVQIFPGNSDNNVHKKNLLEPPIYARYVRILPWEWHDRITLRMELLGCDE